jgi:hypothetical protein
VVGVVVDVTGDGGQRGAEFGRGLWLVRGDERHEEPVIDLGVGDGDADAVAGQDVAVGVREPGCLLWSRDFVRVIRPHLFVKSDRSPVRGEVIVRQF